MVVGVFTCVLYGLGATHPENYHWFTYVWAVAVSTLEKRPIVMILTSSRLITSPSLVPTSWP
jgi:hypothetical protein